MTPCTQGLALRPLHFTPHSEPPSAGRSAMRKNGFAIKVRAKDEFKQFLAEQDAQWNKVIETAGYAK